MQMKVHQILQQFSSRITLKKCCTSPLASSTSTLKQFSTYFHTLDSSKYSFGWIVTPLTQLLLNVLLALALPPEIWASNRNTAHYKLEINPISSAIENCHKINLKDIQNPIFNSQESNCNGWSYSLDFAIHISHKANCYKLYHWEQEVCSTKTHFTEKNLSCLISNSWMMSWMNVPNTRKKPSISIADTATNKDFTVHVTLSLGMTHLQSFLSQILSKSAVHS